MTDEIRVVLADDSPTVRRHLANIISETPGMRVVGEARDGLEAIAVVEQLRPDVISMDISMPRLDGLEATRRIMEQLPTPIVVVSGMLDSDIELSFRALEAGALAVVEKPPGRHDPAFPNKQRHLVKTLAAMSDVHVITRHNPLRNEMEEAQAEDPTATPPRRVKPELVAIGASTGGPSALSDIVRELPADFALPIVVVQHMTDEFISGLARWLDKVSPLRVRVVQDGDLLEPGVVHLSPGTAHFTVVRQGVNLAARLVSERGGYRYQPSVDMLFLSIAQTCGSAAVGCVLTGMGDDGAQGLLAMKQAGAYTLAQNEASSTVFGMPGAAIELGAAEMVISLRELPNEILKII